MGDRFTEIIERYSPETNVSDKWEFIDALKAIGVNASPVKGSDIIYVDVMGKTYSITFDGITSGNMPEEENQTAIKSGPDEYNVDDAVEKAAEQAHSRKTLKGIGAAMVGTTNQKAKTAFKNRQRLVGAAIDNYNKKTKELEQALRR